MPIQHWSEGIWVAQVSDDPSFSEEMDVLYEQLERSKDEIDVIIDLAEIDHLNSSNLSQLLRLRKLMVDRNRQMRLAGPSNNVWAVFLATGLDKVFEFRSNTPQALADLQIGDEDAAESAH